MGAPYDVAAAWLKTNYPTLGTLDAWNQFWTDQGGYPGNRLYEFFADRGAIGNNVPDLIDSYFSHDNFLVASGGHYATSPDSAPLSITGDIDVSAYIQGTDFASVDIQVIASKYVSGASGDWLLVLSQGSILWYEYASYGTGINAGSAIPITSAPIWVRVTQNVTTGLVSVYSAPGATYPTSWTLLGSSGATAGGRADSTGTIEIGSLFGGNPVFGFHGKIYRVVVKNGIAGTVAFDANFATKAIGSPTFTESSANAATVTVI